MKNIKLFVILAIAILIQSNGISAQIASVTSNLSSSQIERKIFKKILALPYYGVFDQIGFGFDGATVTLSGKVNNSRNKKDAERAMKKIDGIKQVINNIEILPPSSFDDQIRRRLLREVARKGLFRYVQEPNPSVRLIVESGHISLEGVVANRVDYNLMNILANGIESVFSVRNNLQIEKEMLR